MKATVLAAALTIVLTAAPAHSADQKGREGTVSGSMSKDGKTHSTHRTVGVVRKIDPKAGTVTLAHEPVKSLNWPAMTMAFAVQDRSLLDKLGEGRKVDVEFEKRGKDYVITGVK